MQMTEDELKQIEDRAKAAADGQWVERERRWATEDVPALVAEVRQAWERERALRDWFEEIRVERDRLRVRAEKAEADRDRFRTLLRDVLAWKVDGSGFEYPSSPVGECIRQGANVDKMFEEDARKMGLASSEDHKALLARLREAGVVEEGKP